ncbi:hypothetical protein ANCCAN_09851 [Ancylostoma caninum]|uniref:Uncharacterized protein n=1 Tax=Ancylostoma caninum TaxID=29170 RepID=A0A368GIG4_ANCCA|nr:hypothetical protein ANCCAN_09851 [Ancylostoma caninum]
MSITLFSTIAATVETTTGVERVVDVSDASQRIQNHMEAVRERYSGKAKTHIRPALSDRSRSFHPVISNAYRDFHAFVLEGHY